MSDSKQEEVFNTITTLIAESGLQPNQIIEILGRCIAGVIGSFSTSENDVDNNVRIFTKALKQTTLEGFQLAQQMRSKMQLTGNEHVQ
jgi:hypothetical protein